MEFGGKCNNKRRRNELECNFRNTKDMKHTTEQGPWSIDKALFLFEELKGASKLKSLKFRYASFWPHFHDLSMVFFSRIMAIAMENSLGTFQKVEVNQNGWCCR